MLGHLSLAARIPDTPPGHPSRTQPPPPADGRSALTRGPDTLTEHYRRIGIALVAAFQRLGLPVHLERSRLRAHPRRVTAAAACFAALARYELSAAGKKLVGSAQKRLHNSLLQHGSIPLWMDRARLFQCLRVPPECRDSLVQEAYTTMTAVNEVAPDYMDGRIAWASTLGFLGRRDDARAVFEHTDRTEIADLVERRRMWGKLMKDKLLDGLRAAGLTE